MKKLIALFLCLMLVLPVAAALADDMTTEITLWTFPVGGFGDDEQVQTLIADFNAVGMTCGHLMRQKVCRLVAPSTCAASTSE